MHWSKSNCVKCWFHIPALPFWQWLRACPPTPCHTRVTLGPVKQDKMLLAEAPPAPPVGWGRSIFFRPGPHTLGFIGMSSPFQGTGLEKQGLKRWVGLKKGTSVAIEGLSAGTLAIPQDRWPQDHFTAWESYQTTWSPALQIQPHSRPTAALKCPFLFLWVCYWVFRVTHQLDHLPLQRGPLPP